MIEILGSGQYVGNYTHCSLQILPYKDEVGPIKSPEGK
jgi:hypothetical protein